MIFAYRYVFFVSMVEINKRCRLSVIKDLLQQEFNPRQPRFKSDYR